jgi:cell division transport system permease protein
MRIWLDHHRAALVLAWRRLWAAPVNTLLSVAAIGIALALPAGGLLLLHNGQQILGASTATPQLSVYLPLSADRAAARAVETRLKALPGLRSVEFVDRETTLARFKSGDGLKEVIEALPRNPFPHAFILSPREDSPQALDALAASLREWKEIEHVQLDSEWARRLDALLRLGRTAVWTLALLLAAGLVGITFNITRLQVLTQREEIEVSALLGATAAFMRRPFLYFGVLLGLGGGLLACLLVAALTAWLAPSLIEIAQLYGVELSFQRPGALHALTLLGGAALLGAIGTRSALRAHLPR